MSRFPWRIISLLCATATASYLCRVNVSVTGALLMSDFGLSQIQMGHVFSAFLLGYALFQIPAGWLADRLGARRVLILSGWWWVISTSLMTFAGRGLLQGSAVFGVFLVLRFALGVGEAPTFPGAAQGVSRWVIPVQHARANGLILAAIGLGSALAPPLLSVAMVRWGWRAALLISAVPALAIVLAWHFACEPDACRHEAASRDSILRSSESPARLRSLRFVLLTASYSLQGYVGYIFVFWFYLYLVQVRHFDLMRSALLSSMPWILSILSIPSGGWISDWLAAGRAGLAWGRRLVPLFGLGLAGVFLALGAHTGNAYMAAVSLALSTALVLCVEGPFWATMMEIAGSRSGTAGGIMNMGSNVGGLISPVLTPVLAASIGWENALLLAAGISIVGAVMWFWITPDPPNR
ncbi:MAG TPA: MFS transporter [Acidobacteriota bacterium]|nr:MFS transporter [Acidobacteriota bacterium]